jgi:hypothetical protein
MFHQPADAAELYALEHRFPFGCMLISLFVAADIGSAVMMLLTQA